MPVFFDPDKPRGASGIGLTYIEALQRAQGEAVELMSSWWWGDEPTLLSHADELDAASVLPEDILLYHPQQLRAREQWNRRLSPWESIPTWRDPTQALHWIAAQDLQGVKVWAPAACCFLASPLLQEATWALAGSNGCAAGPDFDTALIAAFLECVEREAIALWWHHRCQRPAMQSTYPDNAPDDTAMAPLLHWLKARPRTHHVLDLSTDLDIRVFAALSYNHKDDAVAFGFGAHFDPQRAYRSAILEMLQDELMLTVPDSSAEGQQRQCTTLSNYPHLAAHSRAAPPRINTAPQVIETRAALHRYCQRQQLNPLVLDLTRPTIGVPVVRVLVPGMRNYRMALAPGRLYQVPGKLGWHTRTFEEIAADPLPFIA